MDPPAYRDRGGNQNDFAFRIFQYHYRLLDRYHVPVETIAVFTGGKNQNRPSEYCYQCIDTSIHFRYRAYHIFDHEEAELLAMDNPFALIVLACQKSLLEGKVPDTELGEDRLTIAKTLLQRHYDHDRIISFLIFLKSFIYIDDQEINRIFDKEIEKLTGGTIGMGVIEVIKRQERQQGRQEERLEVKTQTVRNLILKSDMSDKQIADVVEVPVSFVKKIRASLKKQG